MLSNQNSCELSAASAAAAVAERVEEHSISESSSEQDFGGEQYTKGSELAAGEDEIYLSDDDVELNETIVGDGKRTTEEYSFLRAAEIQT